jgi:hypothetical protein
MKSMWPAFAYFLSFGVALAQTAMPDSSRTIKETDLGQISRRCNEARMLIAADVSALTGDLARGCKHDSDCALIDPSISCQNECTAAILTVNGERSKVLLDKLAAARCSPEVAYCAAAAQCAPIRGARCTEGSCRVLPFGVQEPAASPPHPKTK